MDLRLLGVGVKVLEALKYCGCHDLDGLTHEGNLGLLVTPEHLE